MSDTTNQNINWAVKLKNKFLNKNRRQKLNKLNEKR